MWWTNLALAVRVLGMGVIFGWQNYLVTQLLVAFFGRMRRRMAFYVQPLTLRSSLKCLKWRIYEEANRRPSGWEALKQYRQGSVII